jgi:UDP-N-acetyl-D-glucosamine dehydrogenase
VEYHDPFIPDLTHEGIPLKSVDLTDERLRSCDCVVIITPHKIFPYDRIVELAPLIFDSRNALKGKKSPNIRRL